VYRKSPTLENLRNTIAALIGNGRRGGKNPVIVDVGCDACGLLTGEAHGRAPVADDLAIQEAGCVDGVPKDGLAQM